MEPDFSQFEHLTDVLGSLQMIKRYSLISLFFRLPSRQDKSAISKDLETALQRVANAFPWLAGKVVYQGRDDTHTGIRKIVPYDGKIPLIQKDFKASDEFPSIDEIVKAGFPISVLDPEKVVPPIANTWASDGFDKYAPVLILQANYIRGGLILTICGNHSTMDMTGLGIIIGFISQASRHEDFTPAQIASGNRDRRDIIPLFDDTYQPGPELDDSLIKPPPPGTRPLTIPAAKWVNLNFHSPSSVAALKTAASAQTLAPYISTDDAISALLWQRISCARATLHPSSASAFQLCRTISLRHALACPSYTGHLVDCTYTRLPNAQSPQPPDALPLGTIAAHLRLPLLDTPTLLHHMRAYATALSRLSDKTKIVNGAQLNPNVDVVVSSYANMKCCESSWGGVLGKPLAARRPDMAAWPSLLYIMPKDRDGATSVAVCLSEKELGWLSGDEVLGRYASFVG